MSKQLDEGPANETRVDCSRDTIEGDTVQKKKRPLKCTGKLCNAKMAVVCTCPASSGAVTPIILQVLRVTLYAIFGIYFQSRGKNQQLESIPTEIQARLKLRCSSLALSKIVA